MLTHAIVRPPAPNFAEGLTTAGLGAPDYGRALKQHEAYCAALERCGLRLIRLGPDSRYPDSTFVEDTAIVVSRCAILTRPGTASRRGEMEIMRGVLADSFASLLEIQTPGTMDGGDVCESGEHFFIGTSERTNRAGAQQLAKLLAGHGYTSSFIDIRGQSGLLHLKSGLAYLGGNQLVIAESLASEQEFATYHRIQVNSEDAYAANCVRVNDYVLVAAGYAKFAEKLRELGHQTIALDMTEFQKMEGGLSCLSLRF